MTTINHSKQLQKKNISKSRNFMEVSSFLDSIANIKYEKNSQKRVLALSEACDKACEKADVVVVGGSNYKESTILFASKILQEEGFKTGTIYSSQILSYAERIFINDIAISNKKFAETSSFVIDKALENSIEATAFEIILVAGMTIFKQENIDTVIIETGIGGKNDATAAFQPIIAAVTKVSPKDTDLLGEDLDKAAIEMMGVAKKDSWFISAEQSKLRLQKMKGFAESKGIKWAMPIRKLTPLPYIFEQLYGKYASLGERIAQIYVEEIKGHFSPFLRGNLLATKKGQRGRPSLEAKKNAEMNPLKNMKSFWQENFELKRGKFEILDKEKPSVLLDCSENNVGLNDLLLGIRLLHYKTPIRDVAIIINISEDTNSEEALKSIRYLTKKVPSELYLINNSKEDSNHDIIQVAQAAKELNIRTHVFDSLKGAFTKAKQTIDPREGVICISGTKETIADYWKNIREVKKL